MIDFIDHVAGENLQGRRKITYDDGTVAYAKIELADEAIEEGTPLNRANLMAIQGVQESETYINDNGLIVTDYPDGTSLQIEINDGQITEAFWTDNTVTLHYINFSNGKIKEVVKEI